ncbi:MAG TPA: hypothetical protein ENH49_01405 [Candidatus Marinimicrobia bacterium]|nr:hypothetical protein [Candidatus Neomarinimicrobiota bacterium]
MCKTYSTQFLLYLFSEHADKANSTSMKRYMKDQFEFCGIKSPKRKELTQIFNRGL